MKITVSLCLSSLLVLSCKALVQPLPLGQQSAGLYPPLQLPSDQYPPGPNPYLPEPYPIPQGPSYPPTPFQPNLNAPEPYPYQPGPSPLPPYIPSYLPEPYPLLPGPNPLPSGPNSLPAYIPSYISGPDPYLLRLNSQGSPSQSVPTPTSVACQCANGTPLCANDGNTYYGQCNLDCHNINTNEQLYVVHYGKCEDSQLGSGGINLPSGPFLG